MNGSGYTDELDAFLDSLEFEEFEEAAPRRRPPVRTPTRRSSFVPRPTPTPASQTQVQAAARNLDSKIETLTNAVKALETRSDGLTAEQQRLGGVLRKEVTARRTTTDTTRAELQQTKTLSVLLPLLTQETATTTDENGREVKVLTQSTNQFATLLPLLLLLPGTSGGGDGKAGGPLGGDMSSLLLLLLITSRK